jgi:hypothetical protein
LADAAGAEVPGDGAQYPVPVEPVMLVEAPVLGGDEGVAYEVGDDGDGDVDAPDVLEVTE